MLSFSTTRRTRNISTCHGTASVAVMNLTTCLALLLLITLAWQNVPLIDPPVRPIENAQASASGVLTWWDVQRFQLHVETRLPQYRRQFEEVAQIHGISWTLLAAQAYQESRWNRYAVSPTGVRGLMMLTRNTASSLGIQNRTDPSKSIEGGARYLAGLKRQVSNRSGIQERTWIALAAYNVGMGHVNDAQQLARRMGKNPHSWEDIKTILPLVSQKKYYTALRHGYARGWEPVQYVQRIRAYQALLNQYFVQV